MDSELNYASWPGADLRSTGQLYFELLNAMLEVELKGGVRMRLRWMSPCQILSIVWPCFGQTCIEDRKHSPGGNPAALYYG